jgi:ABC-type branched-subunit amino acid transport system substrate-binding protein
MKFRSKDFFRLPIAHSILPIAHCLLPIAYCLLSLAYCLLSIASFSQPKPIEKKYKIAIFAPLYLDSVFDASYSYKFGKTFPKFINPGLEFYEGVQLALDSLEKEGAPLEVFIFDTRSEKRSVSDELSNPMLDSISMIIAHTTAPEMKTFADVALEKKIPFINVNLPNDGGVVANPYVVLLNSTLKTHCEGIYRYLQKNYSLYPIIFFRKKGVQEDQIKFYFEDFGKVTSAVPLKIKYVDLDNYFTADQLTPHLDSNKHIVCISGSLDENFGRSLAQHLAAFKNYQLTLFGMPTFDGIKDFNKPEFKGLNIIYSTPFYNPRTDRISTIVSNNYNNKMFGRPSDMVFRGYEATLRFTKLLLQYKSDIASNLVRKQYNIFRDFDIQPVFLNKQNMTLDYFENKKLYFIKKVDGVITSVN